MHAHIHPSSTWFALRIARGSVDQRLQAQKSCIGVIRTGDHCTESPFASSGRYPSECHISCDIDRRYSVLFAPMGSCARPKPSRNLGLSPCAPSPCRLLRTPCWELAFPDVISSIFLWVLGPVPRLAHPVHVLVSSRTTSASPQSKQVRRAGTSTMAATSMMATVFGVAVIHSCSGSHTCLASRLLLPLRLCDKP